MSTQRKTVFIALVMSLSGAILLDITRTQAANEPDQAPQAAATTPAQSSVADPVAREDRRTQIENQNAAGNPPTVVETTDSAGANSNAQLPPADRAPTLDDAQVRAESTSSNADQIASDQAAALDSGHDSQPSAMQLNADAQPEPRAPILASRRLSYQAVLTDNLGNALPGPTVNLAFRIYTSAAVLVEGPINVLAVPINDGVVDTSFPVSASSFDGSDRLLGITVNAGPELAPRITLATVPYALRVDRVLSAELDDNITLGSSVAPLASGSLSIQSGGIAQPTIQLSGNASQISTFGADGLEQIRLWGSAFGEIQLYDSSVTNDQTVLIAATADSGGQMTLRSRDATQVGILLEGDDTGTVSGGAITVNAADGSSSMFLDGDSGGGGLISVRDINGANRVNIDGDANSAAGGGLVTVLQADGSSGVTIDGDASNADTGGLITVHNNLSVARVTLTGQSTNNSGEVSVFSDSSLETIELLGSELAAEGGQILIRNGAGTNTIELDGDSGDAAFVGLRNTAGSNRITMDGDSAGAGLITLYQNDGSSGISLDGDGGTNIGGLFSVNDSVSAVRVQIDGESTGTGGEIRVFDDDGTETIEILGAESTTTGGQILLRDAAGNAEITLDGEFGSVGDPGRITTPVLQITGGSDLSEDFNVNGDAQPGMVMCIDKNNPGMLIASTSAYDHKVAGIVSGAGGVRTGLLMGQRREPGQDHLLVDGKIPVALTGRVYCQVDATDAEIQPGDLLTTSDTPGHAMKVLDYGKAQGAIIGKAMTGLAKGEKGLVLVLVNMQ